MSDMQNIVEQITQNLTASFRSELAQQAERINIEHERAIAAIREETEQANQRTAAQVAEWMTQAQQQLNAAMQTASDAMAQRFVSGAEHITGVASQQINTTAEQAAAAIARNGESLAAYAKQATDAAIKSEAKAVELASERAALDEARAKSEAAEVKARRVVNLMQMQTDAEIQHAQAIAVHAREQKATIEALRAKGDEMQDMHDVRMDVMRRSLDEIYPELGEALAKVVEQVENGTETKAGE